MTALTWAGIVLLGVPFGLLALAGISNAAAPKDVPKDQDEALRGAWKKLRYATGADKPRPRWLKFLDLFVIVFVLVLFGAPSRLELLIFFIAGVAYIEWRDYVEHRQGPQ